MTNDAKYHVIFRGELAKGQNLHTVKQTLAAKFGLTPALIQEAFSGKPLFIKQNIDHQTALKYKAAFEQAGTICQIVPATQSAPAQSVASTAPAAQQPPASPQLYNVVFRGDLAPGAQPEMVKQQFAALCKIPLTQAEGFFSGKAVVVKGNVDQNTAQQCRNILQKIGMIGHIMAAPTSPSPKAKAPSAQAVPTPQQPPEPKPSPTPAAVPIVPPSAVSNARPVSTGTMTCPKCGHEQPHRLRCTRCGIYIKNYQKQPHAAESGMQEGTAIPPLPEENDVAIQEGASKTRFNRGGRDEEALDIERQEARHIVEMTGLWLMIAAIGPLIFAIRYGWWFELIEVALFVALGLSLRMFYSRTGAILTAVLTLINLPMLVVTLNFFRLPLMILLVYSGIRCIKLTFKLHGELADPRNPPSSLAYLVEAGLIVGVVTFMGFAGYQVYQLTRVVTGVTSDIQDLAKRFEDAQKFWNQLPDGSFMNTEFEQWPVPAGKPVRMVVTIGTPGTPTIVKDIGYLFSSNGSGFGDYIKMQAVKSSDYEHTWEATVQVIRSAPFAQFRVFTNTTDGFIDFPGVEVKLAQ